MDLRRDAVSFGELHSKVAKMYDGLVDLLKMTGFDNYIKQNGKFIKDIDQSSLDTRKNDLRKIDCPIVIAGETSSGKSTIMNLLIGKDILQLPTKITASTTKICRIRNATELKIQTLDINEKKIKTWQFEQDERETMANILKDIASSEDPETIYLDIMMPVPIIQGNVIIVDTPGISDKGQEHVAKIMMDYLQHALAVLFVLNVANAGGIQSDRLCRITTHLRNMMNEEMCCFSPEDTIFVLNKWDTIEDDEGIEEFFKLAKDELRNIWTEIDEKHIIKLAASKTSKGDEYMAMFHNFERVLKVVIAKNENKRIKSHLQFLNSYLEECDQMAENQLNNTKLLDAKVIGNIKSLHCEKRELKALLTKAREEHPKLVDEFLNLATERLSQYLLSDVIKRNIFDGTANSTKLTVENNIYSNIDKAVINWEKKHIEEIFLETVKQKFGEKCFEYCKPLEFLRDTLKKLEYTTGWSRFRSAIISTGVVGSLAWGTVMNPVVGASLATVGFTGMLIRKGIFNEFEASREKSFRNKMESFSQGSVKKMFREKYARVATKTIKTMINTPFTRDIDNLEKIIETKTEDLCSNDDVLAVISSLNSTISGLNVTLRAIQNLEMR